VTGRQSEPLHHLWKGKCSEGTRKAMCGERRRGSISLEKPKDGRKKRGGEPCHQALANALVLPSSNKNTVI
jgi:hypothetical protein